MEKGRAYGQGRAWKENSWLCWAGQVKSRVRSPDPNPSPPSRRWGRRNPPARKQPSWKPYLANRARREPLLENSRQLLSSCACGFASSARPPLSVNLGKKIISRFCSLILNPCPSKQLITSSPFFFSTHRRSWIQLWEITKLPSPSTRVKTLLRLDFLWKTIKNYIEVPTFSVFESRIGCSLFSVCLGF